MLISRVETDCIRIDGAPALDPIHVYWTNVGVGQGYATIICYGCAWTVYFGGMGGQTIQEFFQHADTPYLLSKLGNAKATKKDSLYLERIIVAIKAALGQEAQRRACSGNEKGAA